MEIGEFGVGRPDFGGRWPRGEALGNKGIRVTGGKKGFRGEVLRLLAGPRALPVPARDAPARDHGVHAPEPHRERRLPPGPENAWIFIKNLKS